MGSLAFLPATPRLNFRTFPAAPSRRGFVVSFPAPENALAFGHLVEKSPLAPASIDVVSPQLLQLFLEAEKELQKLGRSEEHTSELQSRLHLVCRLLLEKKKTGPLSTTGLGARVRRWSPGRRAAADGATGSASRRSPRGERARWHASALRHSATHRCRHG